MKALRSPEGLPMVDTYDIRPRRGFSREIWNA